MVNAAKILIVEDEMIIAANIAMQLKSFGYQITATIPRGEEVLPSIENSQPDIILMDINLKGNLDGVDIAHDIQKKYKIPLIYLTANADEVNCNR